MKPNYVKFYSEIVKLFKAAEANSTEGLDSLDRETIATQISLNYGVTYEQVMAVLTNDLNVKEFTKKIYSYIK